MAGSTGAPLPAVSGRETPISVSGVAAALESFRGRSLQRPPAYSARHVDGERSYRLARQGVEVTLPESPITVHDVALVALRGDLVDFRATVSAGTYVRALARDLGERLGTAAHLVALRREAIGSLDVERAVPLDALSRETRVLAPLEVLEHLPALALDAEGARDVSHGRPIDATGVEAADGAAVALVREGELAAVAEMRSGRLQPVVVLEGA